MHGMLIPGVMLLHDNVRPHAAARTQALLEHFNWELFDHPVYSPGLSLSDYHMLSCLKNWMGSQRFNSNEELVEGIKMWLSSRVADFFDMGMQKLIPRYDRCLSSSTDYVEK
jgi:hypothetical protein